YQRWAINRKNALRIERDRASQQELGAQLERMRNKAVADLGPDNGGRDATKKLPENPPLNTAAPANPPPSNTPAATPSRRGFDIDILPHGGGGGGAIDPISALFMLITGGTVVGGAWKMRHGK